MSNPRASTDEESAPLLDPTSGAQPANEGNALTRRSITLTTIEKALAVAALLFLLLSATFIGLFAGTAGQLKKARNKPAETVTRIASGSHPSATVTATTTVPGPVVTGKPGKDNGICLTKECVTLASELLQTIDTTIDPCEDFYLFANGGWLNSHSIPSDRGSLGSFQVLQDSNRKIIRDVLEAPNEKPSKDDSPVEQAEKENLVKLRLGYKTCMDERAINKKGVEPILPLVHEITEILGPFLLAESESEDAEETADWDGTYTESYRISSDLKASSEHQDITAEEKDALMTRSIQELLGHANPEKSSERKEALTKALAFAHSRGIGALLEFGIESDGGAENPQIQGLSLNQGGGGLPSKEYYKEKPILDLYTSVVTDILYALSEHKGKKSLSWDFPWPKPLPQEPAHEPKKQYKQVKALAKKVVKFEKAVRLAGGDPEYLFNPIYAYNPYEFNNLTQQLDFISLPAYISSFAPRNFPEKVVVTYPPYLTSLRQILASTPDHVLAAYFVTRVGFSYAKFLGPATPVRKATRRLQIALQGLQKGVPEDRQDFCQAYVDELEGLGLIGGKEFVDRTFAGDSKEKAESVIYNIIDAFKDRLPEVDWMDSVSAKAAAKKADTLQVKIGYPTSPNTTDAVALKNYYSRLEIDDDFFGNGLRQRVLSETRSWQKLGRLRDRGEWLMQPQLVNAYYNPPDSEIVFPAGILRSPFFTAEWPLYLQYGGFGSVAAHELTHAFDNTGAQYDEMGRLRDWWTNSTVKAFQERAQCVARQYSSYSIPGPDGKPVYINGNLTNGEDLGDSGIKFAYNAWKKAAVDEHAVSQRLPGLNFTDDQLFFLSSSRIWARLTKPEAALSAIRTDPHSPNQWRSNGQLRGFEKFAEAFHCKSGSPMNPKKRCDVW